jgi:hypothetical protein
MAGGEALAAAMAAGNHSISGGEVDGGGSDLLVEV